MKMRRLGAVLVLASVVVGCGGGDGDAGGTGGAIAPDGATSDGLDAAAHDGASTPPAAHDAASDGGAGDAGADAVSAADAANVVDAAADATDDAANAADAVADAASAADAVADAASAADAVADAASAADAVADAASAADAVADAASAADAVADAATGADAVADAATGADAASTNDAAGSDDAATSSDAAAAGDAAPSDAGAPPTDAPSPDGGGSDDAAPASDATSPDAASDVASDSGGGDPDAGGDATLSGGGDAGPSGDGGASDAATDGGTDGPAPDECAGGFALSPPGGAISLTWCTEITTPGSYVLGADLNSGNSVCLSIHDTTNVRVDCGGHMVRGRPAVAVANVSGFQITNCNLLQTGDYQPLVKIDQSSHGALDTSQVGGGQVLVAHASDIHVFRNQFYSLLSGNYVSASDVACNAMTNPYTGEFAAGAVIAFNYGNHNAFRENTIDGAWDLVRQPFDDSKGADDGIILSDESDDSITDNTITNVWDTGVETLGQITNLLVARNAVSNCGLYGFGGWYWSNLEGCTFQDNTVDNAQRLFTFYRVYGLRAAGSDPDHALPADTYVAFRNNVFDGNTFTNPFEYATNSASWAPVYDKLDFQGQLSGHAGETVPLDNQFFVTNNVFHDNRFPTNDVTVTSPDFGTATGTVVSGDIVDNGGNVCVASSDVGYPLACASH